MSSFCPGQSHTIKGKPFTKQRLSLVIVDVITLTYSSSCLQVTAGLQAHLTRGLATTWSCLGGALSRISVLQLIGTSHITVARFYKLDVTSLSPAYAVLSVGTSVDLPHLGGLVVIVRNELVWQYGSLHIVQ